MPITYFYAELFGIALIILSLSMLANRTAMLEIVREFLNDRALLFVFAIVSLLVGLFVVLTHNIWNEGLLPLLVTLIGWLFILRSVIILFLPHGTVKRIFKTIRFEQMYYIFAFFALIIGIYLAWNGFTGAYL